jgi:hypothetical protein
VNASVSVTVNLYFNRIGIYPFLIKTIVDKRTLKGYSSMVSTRHFFLNAAGRLLIQRKFPCKPRHLAHHSQLSSIGCTTDVYSNAYKEKQPDYAHRGIFFFDQNKGFSYL